jgi:class 3 adenylate cyclase
MGEPQKTALLLADISGYTQFMVRTREALSHAQAIITELVNALIAEIRIPLRVVEIEGDAVFFCGMEDRGSHSWAHVKEEVGRKLPLFFTAFAETLNDLVRSNMCPCPACRGVSELRLKIICHVGDALSYQVAGFDKLSGPDVILAHRLLKNSIPSHQYLCLTEAAHREIGAMIDGEKEAFFESIEEFGTIPLAVYYPDVLTLLKKDNGNAVLQAGLPIRVKKTLQIVLRGMLIRAGLKKGPTLRNLDRG